MIACVAMQRFLVTGFFFSPLHCGAVSECDLRKMPFLTFACPISSHFQYRRCICHSTSCLASDLHLRAALHAHAFQHRTRLAATLRLKAASMTAQGTRQCNSTLCCLLGIPAELHQPDACCKCFSRINIHCVAQPLRLSHSADNKVQVTQATLGVPTVAQLHDVVKPRCCRHSQSSFADCMPAGM